jgi:PAS domain S-box-containing protein
MSQKDIDDYYNIDAGPFFKSILENSLATCILVLNTEGLILDFNAGFQKFFGYDKEDLLGNHLRLSFTPEDREKKVPELEIEEVLEKGNSMDVNYLIHKDGSYIWVHGESVLVKDDKGNFFILKIIYDINEQKDLEKNLINSQKELSFRIEELDRINKDLDTFVHTASHDLKGPINNMDGLLETLKEELTLEKDAHLFPFVDMLKLSVEKLRRTVVDLSTVAKIKVSGIYDADGVSLKEILHEVKIGLFYEINKVHAEFFEDFSSAPEWKIPRKILKSIIYNLVSNAVKFRRPQIRPSIKVSSYQLEGFGVVEVSDNGLGIKEEDKARIFDKYSRLHNHVEGSGLGMYNVAKMVDDLGGKIEIDSEVGKGTVFKVFLPIS